MEQRQLPEAELELVHEGCNRGQEDQQKEKEMLVIYELHIRIARRRGSLCPQARIARKTSDRIDTIGMIPQKAKSKHGMKQ